MTTQTHTLDAVKKKLKNGKPLSKGELNAVDGFKITPEARERLLQANASIIDNAKRAQSGNVDRRRKYDEKIRNINFAVQIPAVANMRRRKRCEKSLETFLRTYFREEFPKPFSPNMKAVIRHTEEAIEEGGRFACVMPRGSGKTTVLCRAALWAVLTMRRPFLVILAATEPAAARLLQMLHVDISGNAMLLADYPEICAAFHAAEGRPQRLRALHYEGKKLHANATRDRIIFPSLPGQRGAAAGQVIVSRGLTGALRGITHTRPDGVTIRPACVLVDDPQSDESARSQVQTTERESLLSGAVLGLAGPRENVACLVAMTCIRRGDLAERLLDEKTHPEFDGRRFPLVEKWPESDLWKQYSDIWKEDGAKAATKFYKSNRAAMDEGAETDCKWRIRPGELSAIQTAFNIRLEMGDAAFASEMQGEPVEISGSTYQLTIQDVLAHVVDRPRLHLPPATTVFVGHCDINRSGLHWALAGFDQAMTAHIASYGKTPRRGDLWPENAPAQVAQKAIFAGLAELCQQIAATQFTRDGVLTPLQTLLVDASFESDIVHRFAESARYPFKVMPAIGRAAHRYSYRKQTLVGQPMENVHVQRPQSRRCPYVMFNADAWREVMQRSFLGVPGEPGGTTIFHAENARAHMPFAEHIVAEILANKYATDAGPRYEWSQQPGSCWDWADALTGSFAAAALQGLSTSGEPYKPIRVRKRYTNEDLKRRA